MKDQELELNLLLRMIAGMLTVTDVQRAKRELKGHVSGESLKQVRKGKDFVEILLAKGLVNANKLMFLKKVLHSTSLFEPERLLVEYVARKKNPRLENNEDSNKKPDKKTLVRLDALEKTTQRQIVAIKYKQEQLECEIEELERQGITIDVITNKIKLEEVNLIAIKEKRISKGKDLDQYSVRRAETFEAIAQNDRERSKLIEEIATKEAEIKDLEGSAKKGFGRRQSIFELVVNRPSIDKITQVIEKLRREVLNTAKDREHMEYKLEHIASRQERHKEVLRAIDLEIHGKIRQLIELERKLKKSKEDFSEQARKISNIELEIMELENAMEENETEKRRTRECGLKDQSQYRIRARLKIEKTEQAAKFKVLQYDDLDELDSCSFGEEGSRLSPLQFCSPTAVAFDSLGHLLVLDMGNNRVVKTDFLGRVEHNPILLGNVFKAVDMTVNNKGHIILIGSSLVKVLDESGELLFQFLPHTVPHEQLPELSGVSINSGNDIFLCDAMNKKIQCFAECGHFKKFIRLDDSFSIPRKLIVIGRSEIVVSDIEQNNLKVIDISKEVHTEPKIIGNVGVCPGEFTDPCSFALDADNNVLVADSGNHRIQVLNIRKEVTATIGRLGSRPGCLDTPHGVAVHPFGFVVVADTNNNRIVVYS